MKNISRILVCTDFSPTSELALKAAKDFQIRLKAKLIVLHVVEYPIQWDWSFNQVSTEYFNENFEQELMSAGKKRIDSHLDDLKIEGEGVVYLGNPFQIIEKMIKDASIDLLIIGHKGRGESAFILGGLSNKLIASSAIPVFVVKTLLWKNRVAALVDPNSPIRGIITTALELAHLLNCPLEVISLFVDIAARFVGIGKLGYSTKLLGLTSAEREEIITDIRERIKRELPSNSEAIIKVEVSIERRFAFHLNSILAGDHTDTVVMRRHEAAFLEKILIGSETRRMIEIFEGNLMILPP
jgi:nucleotide-binding universal stress UspA family protein